MIKMLRVAFAATLDEYWVTLSYIYGAHEYRACGRRLSRLRCEPEPTAHEEE